jgi:hypothetical protein
LRGNVDQMVGTRVRLGSNVLLSRVNSAQVPTDGSLNAGAGAVGAALQYAPLIPVYRPDGTYTLTTIDFPNELAAIGVRRSTCPTRWRRRSPCRTRCTTRARWPTPSGEVTLVEGLRFRTSVAATCRSAAATPTTRAPRSRARRSAVAPCGRASTTRAS